jgi:hypothetical protein
MYRLPQKEKNLQTALRVAVRRMGGEALKFSSPYVTGWMDQFIFLPGGNVFLAEIKSEGKQPTPLQRVRIRRAQALGFTVFVIDSRETLQMAIITMQAKIKQTCG